MKTHLILLPIIVSIVVSLSITAVILTTRHPIRYRQEFAGRTITLMEHMTPAEAIGIQFKKGFLHYEP